MDLLDQLATEFNQQTILYIGAGASASAGLPTWLGLVRLLRDYTLEHGGNVSTADYYLKEEEFTEAASALTTEIGKFNKSLADFFSDERCDVFRDAKPKKIHELIAQLPSNSVITPNYDLLLEKTYGQLGCNIKVVHKGESELLNKLNRDELKQDYQGYLYKYHGCISMPENIVLDYEHYKREIHGQSVDAELMKVLMQTKTFVFIGAGLRDPDFNYFRDYVSNIIGSKRLRFWAFMRD
jgi:hypothetical protein